MGFYRTLKRIYKPKYIVLNLFILVAYSAIFLYLAYVQGGNAIMASNWPLVSVLIITSSIIMTIAIYSIKNTRRNKAGTVGSAGAVVLGSGLCGCTTAFLPAIAIAAGVGASNVYWLTGFLFSYSVEILSALIIMNLLIIVYYTNKLSSSQGKVK
ncbi:MAG: hypothetical protein BK997_03360 [Candidatus Micrarchaeum sp. ARMAN-1]|nr:MAG: hypothetical protein BK997_03360 [Candidatus Micrarchaeum sp. ARMAN-1]